MRFVGVGAVVEAAVGAEFEYLGKEMRHLMLVHLNGAEPAYARSVNDISAAFARQLKHLGECGCVRACVMHFRYGCGAEVESGYKVVDECGLAYTRIA